MEIPLLGAALIVKNESDYLPGCLEALNALRPLLGEICVYDTGSTDDTVEIARAAGAQVAEGFWDGDFSRARNEAIAMTTAKWVLIVDADERVVAHAPTLRRELRAALTDSMVGFDALQIDVADVRDGGRVEQSWPSTRLLRASRAEYRGRVHENVFHRAPGRDLRERALGADLIHLRHLGYASRETVVAKTARNLDIADRLVAEYEKDPKQREELIRALVDRARSARDQGQIERALTDYERLRGMRTAFTHRAWGLEMYADLLIDLERFDEARVLIAQIRREGVSEPSYCDWLEARRLLNKGEIEAGMDLLRTIDVLHTAAGAQVRPHVLLEARKEAAIALGLYDEAAVCLIRLMAGEGRIGPRSGELLLTLWGKLPRRALVEMLVEADGGFLRAVADEFDTFDAGRDVASALRVALGERETART